MIANLHVGGRVGAAVGRMISSLVGCECECVVCVVATRSACDVAGQKFMDFEFKNVGRNALILMSGDGRCVRIQIMPLTCIV